MIKVNRSLSKVLQELRATAGARLVPKHRGRVCKIINARSVFVSF